MPCTNQFWILILLKMISNKYRVGAASILTIILTMLNQSIMID